LIELLYKLNKKKQNSSLILNTYIENNEREDNRSYDDEAFNKNKF